MSEQRRGFKKPGSSFWDNAVEDGDCWVWTAVLNRDGYGHWNADGVMNRAHRYAYEDMVGPIPDGLVIDHLCRNRACINPDHLDPVTIKVNTIRGKQLITHCPQGHEYTKETTFIRKDGRGGRHCRICGIARSRERRERLKRELDQNEVSQ